MRGMSATPFIFDRPLLRRRRDRAAATQHRVAPVAEALAARLLDRLDDTTRRFGRALEIGGRGLVAPALRDRGIPFVASMDLSPRQVAGAGALAVAGDEEWLPFAAASFDLVVANFCLHWVNDLPGALAQIRRAMAPDGLFLATMPALGTLQPLREALTAADSALRGGASPRVSPFPELRDGAALLQRAGFALPVADLEEVSLAYRDPLLLLRDLQAAGETSAILSRDGRIPPRQLFPAALAALPAGPEGTPVTIRLLTLTGWSPGPDQPRAARPGSATVRLSDALGVPEHKAGDAAG